MNEQIRLYMAQIDNGKQQVGIIMDSYSSFLICEMKNDECICLLWMC